MDSSSGDDPARGFDDAIGELEVNEVTVEDGDQQRLQQTPPALPQDPGPATVTPAASSTTGGLSASTAQPAAPARPDLTTPAGLGAVRDVLQHALSSTASGGLGGAGAGAATGAPATTSATASGASPGTMGPGQPSVAVPGQPSGVGHGLLNVPVTQVPQQPLPVGNDPSQGGTLPRVTWVGGSSTSNVPQGRPSLRLPQGGGQFGAALPGAVPASTPTGPQAGATRGGVGLPYPPSLQQGSRSELPPDPNLIQAQIDRLQAQLAATQRTAQGQGPGLVAPPGPSSGNASRGYGAQASQYPTTYGKMPGSGPSTTGYPMSQGPGTPAYASLPTPRVRTPMTAIASYGGYALNDVPGTPGFGFGNPFFQPLDWSQAAQQQQDLQAQLRAMQPSPTFSSGTALTEAGQPAGSGLVTAPREYGMPSSIKNAVRMIQPFYSDGATVEKAVSFWEAFERATEGLNDVVRLSAFRECLKGKSGENWWMYSQIEDFDTLRRRFHNQFICQTPLQMIERLKTTKRAKGMSAEVWGDQVSSLCDAAQCSDPQMRYQYFLSGLRNKEWKTALTTTMVKTIPQAVMVLLYKNMHIPVEDDGDFEDEVAKKADPESPMMQQMMNLMQQTQGLLVQQQQQLLARSPRSPRSRSQPQSFVDAAYEDPMMNICAATENDPGRAGTGRRMGPDDFTREGISVCGRCHYKGCRRETCRYNNMTCNNCRERGHVAFECDQPRRQGNGGRPNGYGAGQPSSLNGGQSPRTRKCFFCASTDHLIASCPARAAVLKIADGNGAGAKSSTTAQPSQ